MAWRKQESGFLRGDGGPGQVRAGVDSGLNKKIRESVRKVVGLYQTCRELRPDPRLHIPVQQLYFATSPETFMGS